MSSKAFPARTSHTNDHPQICGLQSQSRCFASMQLDEGDEETDVDGAIIEGDVCFYLTCRGDQATPITQIQRSNKKDGYSTGYRTIPSGQTRTVGKPPYTRQVPIFKWQEQAANQRWHDVAVWERMVHVECAKTLGYAEPTFKGTARRGARTKGFAHRVKADPISGLEELAVVLYEADQEVDA